ncbi:hypothetical protein SK128_005608 [Halocaridina rubra]|uniref:Uncharacterized protein n=1 Tax=Halocaridina rubra TaxID=373956 RepID=A0AAN9A9L3_HALRR
MQDKGFEHMGSVEGMESSQDRWLKKSLQVLQDLLENAESDAQYKGMDINYFVIELICVQCARQNATSHVSCVQRQQALPEFFMSH